ncbi:MAG: hypothetical protein LC644_02170 [Pseudonocardia sp.]|nr:hypothetical protein [Pseudonocardia sp.]
MVVIVVVIGFLIGIVRALESIDNGLFTSSNLAASATGNVQPLPNYIHTINSALADIDTALKPIRGQVADATASLVDTSNVLLNVLGIAQTIDGTLESIQNADSRGTALITPQVNDINNSLIGAEQDLFNINLQLQETNRHLTNICTSPTLSLLPPFKCHP